MHTAKNISHKEAVSNINRMNPNRLVKKVWGNKPEGKDHRKDQGKDGENRCNKQAISLLQGKKRLVMNFPWISHYTCIANKNARILALWTSLIAIELKSDFGRLGKFQQGNSLLLINYVSENFIPFWNCSIPTIRCGGIIFLN